MRRNKYNAKKKCMCLRCGGPAATFDSLLEADYFWTVLKPLWDAGEISDVRVHPSFKLPGNVRVLADFAYLDKAGENHVIDVKGDRASLTATFKRNRKMVEAIHGVDIEVVRHKR